MTFEKDNEQYAYFCIEDFPFAPEEMTKKLGLEPTTTWRKGDVHPKSRFEIKHNRWMLYTRLAKEKYLEDHVKDVLHQLEPCAESLIPLTAEFSAKLQLVGYFYQSYPGFQLDREDTRRIGAYNLILDCDFYYLYDHEREGTE
jgi:hypothetical protein